MAMEPRYLGDGVYVHVDESWQIWLTTSDGISTTNRITLEPTVLTAFIQYIEEWKKEINQK